MPRRVLAVLTVLVGCHASTVVAPAPVQSIAPSPGSTSSLSSLSSASTSSPSTLTSTSSPTSSGSGASSDASIAAIGSASVAPSASASVEAAIAKVPVCHQQKAFEYLIRKSYIPVKAKKKEFAKSLEWRTRQYGFVKGFGDPTWNASKPKDHVVSITLFGLPVRVHQKIIPALRCAEEEVVKSCKASPYVPTTLSGIREKNTYHGGEVTNHLYGIALDIDPLLNSCCGCTTKWKGNPQCKKKKAEIWDKMAMPKCWVESFEKYGFYWLGHDVLQDTMHFEFLADPDLVMQLPP